MIEARGLTKSYGPTVAVSELSFTVRPGLVTGFLGPNGAGKTTTMRMILGLDHPSAGSVTIGGILYPDAPVYRCARSAPCWTRGPCTVAGLRVATCSALGPDPTASGRRRVDEVMGIVGLTGWPRRGKRSKGFSLGMSQRLGIAAALLGDPQILMFDEPVNGLDPEGIVWIRTLMRSAGRPRAGRSWSPAI